MIYDSLQNIEQYVGLFMHLDTAIDFIGKTDLDALPMGKTVIDGDNVYVNVMEAETAPSETKDFETHSKYMDLQLDLDGVEICEVALGEMGTVKEYNEETDFALWSGETSTAMILGEDRFAIFMVEEPHKPNVQAEGYKKIKKAVFKIKYE